MGASAQASANALILDEFKQIIRVQDAKLNEQIAVNHSLQFNYNQMQEYCNQLVAQLNSSAAISQTNSGGSADKLQMQARINELEVKCNLLEEK